MVKIDEGFLFAWSINPNFCLFNCWINPSKFKASVQDSSVAVVVHAFMLYKSLKWGVWLWLSFPPSLPPCSTIWTIHILLVCLPRKLFCSFSFIKRTVQKRDTNLQHLQLLPHEKKTLRLLQLKSKEKEAVRCLKQNTQFSCVVNPIFSFLQGTEHWGFFLLLGPGNKEVPGCVSKCILCILILLFANGSVKYQNIPVVNPVCCILSLDLVRLALFL